MRNERKPGGFRLRMSGNLAVSAHRPALRAGLLTFPDVLIFLICHSSATVGGSEVTRVAAGVNPAALPHISLLTSSVVKFARSILCHA